MPNLPQKPLHPSPLSAVKTAITTNGNTFAITPELVGGTTGTFISNRIAYHISSSLIKQIARMAQGNVRERLKDFVPEVIIDPLLARVDKI